MAIEEAVFLRAPCSGDCKGGRTTESLAVEVFRESHENGPVNFLGWGGTGVCRIGGGCDCGGADHGTAGRTPDRPCSDGFTDLGGGAGFESSEKKKYCKHISYERNIISVGTNLWMELGLAGRHLRRG